MNRFEHNRFTFKSSRHAITAGWLVLAAGFSLASHRDDWEDEPGHSRAQAVERQAPAPGAGASRPATRPGKDSASKCERLWHEYFKSQECFAPYFTVHGIKAEAFEHCKEIGSPAQQCGPAKKIGTD